MVMVGFEVLYQTQDVSISQNIEYRARHRWRRRLCESAIVLMSAAVSSDIYG